MKLRFNILVGSLISSLIGSLIAASGWSVAAEITPDSTLAQPSRVTPTGRRIAITAGTRRGRNLFHSFREFSVDAGQIASFQGVDPGIANVFARVTGRNQSRINGTIEALQSSGQISTANLFLLNPNGIIFGRNAALRIGGSFIATTANQIDFNDGLKFSAVNPQGIPPLTMSVPVGLQFGARPGQIVNRSSSLLVDETGNPQLDFFGSEILGLVGSPSQTFALIGGNVTSIGGGIIANGGRIEIGSVAGNSRVSLSPIPKGWDVSYSGVERFGDVQLLNFSALDVTGNTGGTIQIQARRVRLQGQSFAVTDSTSSTQSQFGGPLIINATDSIVVEQTSDLGAFTRGSGRGGDIRLTTPRLDVWTGSRVGSVTYGSGRGGDVTIKSSEGVTVAGTSSLSPADLADNDRPPLSLINAQSQEGAGRAGNINITTGDLRVESGGQISTTAFARGNAGNLRIRADQIELSGIALYPGNRPWPDPTTGLPAAAGLFVGNGRASQGTGGTLTVNTQRLNVQDGAIIQASTYGSGRAGNIDIVATDSTQVSGSSADLIQDTSALPLSFSRITATSGGIPEAKPIPSATGRGGDINLTTGRLVVQDGGIISVNSRNQNAPRAGTIRVRANQVLLNNQGELNAQTESGSGAEIELSGVDLLTLRGGSKISTSAGLNSGGGNGGNITINAGLVVDGLSDNSDIDANAGQGNGGNIAVNAEGILGIAKREQQTPQSDITATSNGGGVNGEINLSTPSLDPTQGVAELPSTVVDASQLIAQGCRAGNRPVTERLGEFVITGRGGLPPIPSSIGSSETVITNWAVAPSRVEASSNREADRTTRNSAITTQTSDPNQPANQLALQQTNQPIIEAQGWVVGANGKIALVANTPTAVPHSPSWILPACSSQAPAGAPAPQDRATLPSYETIEPVASRNAVP
jgi:filamentous hemagglutinin family protein